MILYLSYFVTLKVTLQCANLNWLLLLDTLLVRFVFVSRIWLNDMESTGWKIILKQILHYVTFKEVKLRITLTASSRNIGWWLHCWYSFKDIYVFTENVRRFPLFLITQFGTLWLNGCFFYIATYTHDMCWYTCSSDTVVSIAFADIRLNAQIWHKWIQDFFPTGNLSYHVSSDSLNMFFAFVYICRCRPLP